ncbi:hypothetical protein [Paenibacillus sp. VMFN-D1]|uniref:hypothetical protein n=1 Tax=Paenibacillus sp. VMFN-D1 TaxID=2135608 RepID=UPI000E265721|nr:hypothetical protein [Paenibacillus sp. VMFN-D1]
MSIMEELKQVGCPCAEISAEVQELAEGTTFVPDITIKSGQTAQVAAASEQQLATMQEISSASFI